MSVCEDIALILPSTNVMSNEHYPGTADHNLFAFCKHDKIDGSMNYEGGEIVEGSRLPKWALKRFLWLK